MKVNPREPVRIWKMHSDGAVTCAICGQPIQDHDQDPMGEGLVTYLCSQPGDNDD